MANDNGRAAREIERERERLREIEREKERKNKCDASSSMCVS
jgi:hypothetical protein